MEWMVNNIQLTWMLRTYKLCNSNGEIFKYEIYQFSKVTHGSKNPYMRVRDAKIKRSVKSGIWTHAHSRRPKLNKVSEVGFEPTPSREDQNLSLAP